MGANAAPKSAGFEPRPIANNEPTPSSKFDGSRYRRSKSASEVAPQTRCLLATCWAVVKKQWTADRGRQGSVAVPCRQAERGCQRPHAGRFSINPSSHSRRPASMRIHQQQTFRADLVIGKGSTSEHVFAKRTQLTFINVQSGPRALVFACSHDFRRWILF